MISAWPSYLFIFVVLSSAALGSLIALSFAKAIPVRWIEPVRPALISLSRVTYALPFLFLPIALDLNRIYPWANETWRDPFRHFYFNETFFVARGFLYLLLWAYLAGHAHRTRHGFIYLILLLVTGTIASTDWVMSLDPEWHSTGFGLIFLASSALFALGICLSLLRPPQDTKTLLDLNNVHLTLLCFWSYLAFIQFLVVWSANLPSEAQWYVSRLLTSWKDVAVVLAALQFGVPFACLLFRAMKRSPAFTQRLGILSMCLQTIYVYWLIFPSIRPDGWILQWSEFAAFLILFAAWLSLGVRSAPIRAG